MAALRKANKKDKREINIKDVPQPLFDSPMSRRPNTFAIDPAAQNVMDAVLTADGLKSSVNTLETMANAIEPIVDKFDAILVSVD